jgi:hypothetical protein
LQRPSPADGTTVSDDAHQAAMAWAEQARATRAAVTDDLTAGRRSLDDVLDGRGDDLVGRIKLLAVLEALPDATKVGTRRRLAELGLEQATPIAELDDAQLQTVREAFA